mmetsp:Transcript_1038/g.907  ORF Transcript_1038/g.907 Transcript_1038/m.907 type:complete len:138 (+) Transcript_1038:704-1117(+)
MCKKSVGVQTKQVQINISKRPNSVQRTILSSEKSLLSTSPSFQVNPSPDLTIPIKGGILNKKRLSCFNKPKMNLNNTTVFSKINPNRKLTRFTQQMLQSKRKLSRSLMRQNSNSELLKNSDSELLKNSLIIKNLRKK